MESDSGDQHLIIELPETLRVARLSVAGNKNEFCIYLKIKDIFVNVIYLRYSSVKNSGRIIANNDAPCRFETAGLII